MHRSTARPVVLALSVACACGDGANAPASGTGSTQGPMTGLTETLGLPGTTGLTADIGTTSAGGTQGPTTGSTSTSTGTGAAATTSSGTDTGATTTGTTTDTTTGAPCSGLACQVDPCDGDPARTRVTGVVYTPKGTLPLPGVTVHIPGSPLAPLADGVACDACADGLPGDPIVATLSDTHGAFILEGVPAGKDIPLVISVGKWRREVVIPEVVACSDNAVAAELTRLPRNQSEGHIPRIAVTTGRADTLECLLRKIGVEDGEFTPVEGPGRVNLFAGATGSVAYAAELNGGVGLPAAAALWDDLEALKRYDLVLMSCEGQPYGEQKSAQARENIVAYADLGGRLFLSHWHNVWIQGGPAPWPSTATFTNLDFLDQAITAQLDTSFPKGKTLAAWMLHVGGSQQLGSVKLTWIKHTVDAINPATSTRWVHTKNPAHVQYFSFNSPVGVPAAQQCGRVVNTDIHVVSGNAINEDPFPTSCVSKGLTPQEKIIAFMLFDISACLIPDSEDPIPG